MLSDLSYYAFGDDNLAQKIATYVREHPTETRTMLAQLRGYGQPTQAQVSQAQIELTAFLARYPSDRWDTLSPDTLAYVQLHKAALEQIIAQRQGPTAVTVARSKLAQAETTNAARVQQQYNVDTAPTLLDKLASAIGTTGKVVAIGGAALLAFIVWQQMKRGGGNRSWG